MEHQSANTSDFPVPPCGHANPPTANFCDICGARLPLQCPDCHAINRREANYCGNCGSSFHGIRPRSAIGRPAEPPLETPAVEPHSTSAAPDAVAADQTTDDIIDASHERADPLGDDAPDEAARLQDLKRFFAQQDHRAVRRARGMWLAGGGVLLGLAVVILTIVYLTPRASHEPPLDADARAPHIALDGESKSSPSSDGQAASSASPPDATMRLHPRQGAPDRIARDAVPSAGPSTPRAGGELRFVVPGEPPSYDAHREETFALIHPAAPHYNTLLRIDPFDPEGTRVVGDLATSWTVSSDKRTYVLKLRRGVKFHDGSEMTSRDVRATYEKIINPPPGVTSARKGEYLQIETVQAPEPYVIAFKLRWPSPSFVHSLASPWNWIYKADILERDVRWYEKHINGTGPFVFVEHVKGSRWVGRRNPEYWDYGKPYLDGYQALFVSSDAAQVAAIRSGDAQIQFRGFSPSQRDELQQALGDKITVQMSPWNCVLVVAINHDKAPFDDSRMRRALSLALDRYSAANALSTRAIVRDVAGVQLPGSPFATPPAQLLKLPGYWPDIAESRSEARRLLSDAGIPDGFSFVLKNRDIPMPYHHIANWLVDEWRKIGLNVRHEIQPSAQYFKDLRAGNFDLSTDFQCGYVVDPDLDLYKFQSAGRTDANYSRYTDPVLDDLYVRQSRAIDPQQRRRYIRAFEKRLLADEARYIYTLQWHRIVPHSSRVRGWTITPSHYVNNQLDTVWLAN
jgi:peptide/nickel transport system substrate-binding protein